MKTIPEIGRVSANRRLSPEQVHFLLVRNIGDNESCNTNLCFVVNFAEDNSLLARLFNLLNRMKDNDYMQNYISLCNELSIDKDDTYSKFCLDNYNQIHDMVTAELRLSEENASVLSYALLEIKSDAILFAKVFPSSDQNLVITTMLEIAAKSKANEDVSVAICTGSRGERGLSPDLHFVGFTLSENRLLYADSLASSSFASITKASVHTLNTNLREISGIIKTEISYISQSIDKFLCHRKSKVIEPYNMIVKLKHLFLSVLSGDESEISNDVKKFINDELNTFLEKIKKEGSFDNQPNNIDSNGKIESNKNTIYDFDNKDIFNYDKYVEFFSDLTKLLNKFVKLLEIDGYHDYLAIKCAKNEIEKNKSDMAYGFDDCYDSDLKKLSINKLIEYSSLNLYKEIFKYIGSDVLEIQDYKIRQQSGGYQCGYFAVCNIREQRRSSKEKIIPDYIQSENQDQMVEYILENEMCDNKKPVLTSAYFNNMLADKQFISSSLNLLSIVFFASYGALFGFLITKATIDLLIFLTLISVIIIVSSRQNSKLNISSTISSVAASSISIELLKETKEMLDGTYEPEVILSSVPR